MKRPASVVDVNTARSGNCSFFAFLKMCKSTKHFEEINEEFEIHIKRAKKLRNKLLKHKDSTNHMLLHKLLAKIRIELQVCQELYNAMDQ
jgi:hypothetical protein